MNGIHDMGGMHGFGRVVREENEPVFHEPWEGRAFAMIRAIREKVPPRRSGREIIEGIEPARYLSSSYYERYLEVLEHQVLDAGVITEAEIESRMRLIDKEGSDPVAPTADPGTAQRVVTRLLTDRRHPAPSGGQARFAVDDAVVVRNLNWPGHNRLPRYIRGKHGVIARVNGWHRIEDAHADALGPDPQTVYTVRFDGAEVWGPESEAGLTIYMELWEGYLEPANER
jgi:nitrile hydratase